MSRSTSRCFREAAAGTLAGRAFAGRTVFLWLAPLFVGLALAAGGCRTAETPVKPTARVEDRFIFRVFNQALQPLPGAEIKVSLEAGQSLTPLPLVTDETGLAVLRVKALEDNLVAGVDSRDRLVKYRSAISYRIDSPGRLPGWGRADLIDSFEEFTRPSFSAVLNSAPRNKTLPVRHVLYRTEEFFQKGALKDPLARTLAVGLKTLWRTWSFTGRINRLKPTPFSLAVVHRSEGPYFKLALDLENALEYTEDSAVHKLFETELIPVLDDLAALYAPLLAGWDITFNLAYRPQGDPHAMPLVIPLRLVFSERVRTFLITQPGGLNWLIPKAEVCTLKDKPWRPLETLAREDRRQEYIWSVMPLFFVPGSGQADKTAEIKDTSEEPLPISPGPF